MLNHLDKMNESQRKAVTHGEGPLMLLAGPGSGKTFTITNRILYLLNKGVAPENILVITFTREAAQSMQKRFQSLCGKNTYPVNFGTFHSVFYHILRESKVLKSNKLLTHSEKIQILFPILTEYAKQALDSTQIKEDAGKLLSCFAMYKNTMELTTAVKRVPSIWQGNFLEIYERYRRETLRLGQLDFDDILYECKIFLEENPMAREYWSGRFEHILMDEFQDINPVQYEIVKLLSKSPYNLFAVGDDDQSIYGFRGSKPECMKRFVEEFHATQMLLDVNYRSTPEIVNCSLAVIEGNKNRFAKKIRAAAEMDFKTKDFTEANVGELKRGVKVKGFENKEEQYGYLLQKLIEKQKVGENSAVLFRTNQYMQGMAVRLKRAGICYEMREKVRNIYEHTIVQDILAYLQLAKGCGNREQLLRIMNKPSRYIRREAACVKDGRIDFVKIKEYYVHSGFWESDHDSALCRIAQFEKQMKLLAGMPLLTGIHYILKVVGFEAYLKEVTKGNVERRDECEEMIRWVKEDAAEYKSLEKWLAFIQEYEAASGYRGEADKKTVNQRMVGERGLQSGINESKHDGKIQLLTVHGAKGLEFDHVWIPDCNERIFPYGRMLDENTVEEERRIFYVAMTRAKKSLELLYLTGTKERPRQPSAFLTPLFFN